MVSDEDFDMEVLFTTMERIIEKYEIRYDPQNPVSDDDELADRVFEAAADFLAETGAYCMDTSRIMQFDKKEVLETMKEGHSKLLVGEGADAKIWLSRRPELQDHPWCHVGSGILSTSDELAVRAVEGYGAIQRADSVAIPALNTYKGIPITPKHPLEVKVIIRTTSLAREALGRIGRPGLAVLNGVPTSGSALGVIAPLNPEFGMGPRDGWLIPVYAEMRVSYENLAKVAFLQEHWANHALASSAMLGGYMGGPEGVAVASVAYVFLGAMVFGANYHCNFPITLMDSISTTREVLWAISVSCQALARNTTMPVYNIGMMANGPATENYFYEAVAYILTSIVSGVTVQTPYPAKGVMADGMTPLEAIFHSEIIDITSKFKRHQANEIVLKLLEKYEPSLQDPDLGRSYPECFHIRSNKPDDDYARLYDTVKKEIGRLGLHGK
jgi:hypothetical protein